MLIDARELADGSELVFDVCIAGAGAAGITIAKLLAKTNLRVGLVESGGFEPDPATQRLYSGEVHGDPYFTLDACRFRMFGGNTNRWGGMCRPLDADDFAPHAWLGIDGWPIREKDVLPFYETTAGLLQLRQPHFDVASWAGSNLEPFDLQSDFENAIIQYSPQTNFGVVYRAELVEAPNMVVVLHGNVRELFLDEFGKRIASVSLRTLNSRNIRVRTNVVVLATGALENACLLLASTRDRATGLGNENDMVGRCFMEHLHAPVGHLIVPRGTDARFYERPRKGVAAAFGIIVPAAGSALKEMQPVTSLQLLPPSYEVGTPFIQSPAAITARATRIYRRTANSRFFRLASLAKRVTEKIANASLRMATANAARAAASIARREGFPGIPLSLYMRGEQIPSRSNRVTLSSDRNVIGMPKAVLNWSVSSEDLNAVRNTLNVFAADVAKRGLGMVVLPRDDWTRQIIGGPHHMGTTRMSASPQQGVVDANCRVHSVENLYIAGSSIFSTGGYANPTFTIVALAVRLAAHLQQRFT